MEFISYADDLDALAQQQVETVRKLTFVSRMALMADAHGGYTAPIGSVIESERVCPAWVGYDIGCRATTTTVRVSEEEFATIEATKWKIFEVLCRNVNGGLAVTKDDYTSAYDTCLTNVLGVHKPSVLGIDVLRRELVTSYGSVGGGNHFVEVGYIVDADQPTLAITVHSGSRSVGHGIATAYMNIAAPLFTKDLEQNNCLPKQLVFDYLGDVQMCERFSAINHRRLTDVTLSALGLSRTTHDMQYVTSSHNSLEFTGNSFIHRKGASDLRPRTFAVILGNSRDGSAIVFGLDTAQSIHSVSHGAGRCVSRSKALEHIDMDTFKASMEGIAAKVTPALLEEAPAAYKDFEKVLAAQSKLFVIAHRIKPMICFKRSK